MRRSNRVRMRSLCVVLLSVFCSLFFAVGLAYGHPDDDKSGLFDDGTGQLLQHHAGAGLHLPASNANVDLVGKLRLTDVTGGIADVGVYGKYAYVNHYQSDCPNAQGGSGNTGTDIIDISDPVNPVKVGSVASLPNSYHGEGVQVIHIDTPSFTGEVLIVSNEACNSSANYTGGSSLYDVTDPLHPTVLASAVGDPTSPDPLALGGVGATHSAFGWYVPETNKAYILQTENSRAGTGDIDIIDITNPRSPTFLTSKSIVDFPAASPKLERGEQTFNHDFQIKKIGDHWYAALSYWDRGWVTLNVDNPANPTFVKDYDFPFPDTLLPTSPSDGSTLASEGNAHQVWWSSSNKFLIGTQEDFSPERLVGKYCQVRVGELQPLPCYHLQNPFFSLWPQVPTFASIFGAQATVSTVWGGSGCPFDLDGNGQNDRGQVLSNFTHAQTGADFIVFERGACTFTAKVQTAALAGYLGVALANSHAGSGFGASPDGLNCGGQSDSITGNVPAGLCISHKGLHTLFGDASNFTGPDISPGGDLLDIPLGRKGLDISVDGTFPSSLSGVYDGWGYVRLMDGDVSSPTFMNEVGAYAIPEALDPAFLSGYKALTVHEVQTDARAGVNLAYFAWYGGGFRVAKFGDGVPGKIQEVGHYIDTGGNEFWGIEPVTLPGQVDQRPYLLLSDRDYGLYIFRMKDTTKPTITINKPAAGDIYKLNEPVNADFKCKDEIEGSGLASCTAKVDGNPINDGAALPTSAVGSHTITVTATDNAGNTDTASRSYSVQYVFTGFSSPVDNNGVLNRLKAGQSVPLKWRLTDYNGVAVTNLTAANVVVTVVSLSCPSPATADQLEEVSAGSSGLQNLGNGYYQYNWKTPTTYANSCKTLRLDLKEGIYHTANFQFTK